MKFSLSVSVLDVPVRVGYAGAKIEGNVEHEQAVHKQLDLRERREVTMKP